MMSKDHRPNRSVKCSVNSCKNHCGSENYCSLECVCIGTHEGDPAMNECTDCLSFENVCGCEQARAVRNSEQALPEHETNY